MSYLRPLGALKRASLAELTVAIAEVEAQPALDTLNGVPLAQLSSNGPALWQWQRVVALLETTNREKIQEEIMKHIARKLRASFAKRGPLRARPETSSSTPSEGHALEQPQSHASPEYKNNNNKNNNNYNNSNNNNPKRSRPTSDGAKRRPASATTRLTRDGLRRAQPQGSPSSQSHVHEHPTQTSGFQDLRGPERFFHDQSTYTGTQKFRISVLNGTASPPLRPWANDNVTESTAVPSSTAFVDLAKSPWYADVPICGPERFFYDKESFTGTHRCGGPDRAPSGRFCYSPAETWLHPTHHLRTSG
ncbi:unnamed protein product [Polarella glacialis]|uniref:Uncharacterized protein n=1 Tax=Polarella glacialis TaxID=89957 RepID=A0A813HJN4_POLGL|nr:unnamed protein product [Polarella glacialis]